ncbi:MAG: PIG-L deacetylase family protein, partial [Micromonosporaceae bacterium]
LEPWTVREVWFSGGPDPDHYVDITDTFDQKLAALQAHVSQLPDPEGTMRFLREWTGENAKTAGFGEGRMAESFTIVSSA